MSQLRGIRAFSGQSYASIEEKAAEVRRAMGLKNSEAIDSMALLHRISRISSETASGTRVWAEYGIEEIPEEARTYFDRNTNRFVIALREDVYIGLCVNDPRARFTLCHEVGHLTLHSREVVHIARSPAALTRVQHEVFRDTEWQADVYAGALLMPAAGVAEFERISAGFGERIDARFLHEQFDVSYAAAETRLRILRGRFRKT